MATPSAPAEELCERCGAPAGIVLPQPKNGVRRVCGPCWREVNADPARPTADINSAIRATRHRSITPDSRTPLIEPAVRAKLEAIEAEARAKGWPPELLWNGNFWDCPRGLAAVLDPGDEITEVAVAVDHITILKVKRDLLNFRRYAA